MIASKNFRLSTTGKQFSEQLKIDSWLVRIFLFLLQEEGRFISKGALFLQMTQISSETKSSDAYKVFKEVQEIYSRNSSYK